MSNANTARIVAAMGSTGTGKSLWVRRQISRPRRSRIIVWSPKEPIDQYAQMLGATPVASAAALLQLLEAASFRVVVEPPAGRRAAVALFDVVCLAALAVRNCCLVVEELHTVTEPSRAPEGWSRLTMMGRGYGIEVFGVSQRPASVDKDFWGNCTLVHSGRLGYEDDAKVLAKALAVPWPELMNLPDLAWIERDPQRGGEARRGFVKV